MTLPSLKLEINSGAIFWSESGEQRMLKIRGSGDKGTAEAG